MVVFDFKCPTCGHIESVPGVCGKGPIWEPCCNQCADKPWRAQAMIRIYNNRTNYGPGTRYDEHTNYQLKNL